MSQVEEGGTPTDVPIYSYVFDEMGSIMCGISNRIDAKNVLLLLMCCIHEFPSSPLVVTPNTKSPWLSQRPERDARVPLYHRWWTTAAACCSAGVVVLLCYCCTAVAVLSL